VTTPPPQAGPEQDLLRQLEVFWRTLREAAGLLVRDAECSRSTATLVRVLAERDRAGRSTQVGDVAQVMRVDTSVASRHVSQLVEEGLVERTVGTGDKRARALRLTPLGRERSREIDAALVRRTGEIFAGWDPQDVADAAATLHRLSRTIDEASAPPARERALRAV